MQGMISENYVNQGTVIVLFIHFLIITYYLINTIHFWTTFCYIKQGPSVTSIQKIQMSWPNISSLKYIQSMWNTLYFTSYLSTTYLLTYLHFTDFGHPTIQM